ncbi:hypothetical protein AWB65_05802 [Caballeronia humi]|uniref:Uncharacterized protein n=1 Tax=Caballeronia humi TaxID=326474 RepID=A0A158J206_9BURK|nr:hypothetical protein AWB65_05802 [Caballeronia humi]
MRSARTCRHALSARLAAPPISSACLRVRFGEGTVLSAKSMLGVFPPIPTLTEKSISGRDELKSTRSLPVSATAPIVFRKSRCAESTAASNCRHGRPSGVLSFDLSARVARPISLVVSMVGPASRVHAGSFRLALQSRRYRIGRYSRQSVTYHCRWPGSEGDFNGPITGSRTHRPILPAASVTRRRAMDGIKLFSAGTQIRNGIGPYATTSQCSKSGIGERAM